MRFGRDQAAPAVVHRTVLAIDVAPRTHPIQSVFDRRRPVRVDEAGHHPAVRWHAAVVKATPIAAGWVRHVVHKRSAHPAACAAEIQRVHGESQGTREIAELVKVNALPVASSVRIAECVSLGRAPDIRTPAIDVPLVLAVDVQRVSVVDRDGERAGARLPKRGARRRNTLAAVHVYLHEVHAGVLAAAAPVAHVPTDGR